MHSHDTVALASWTAMRADLLGQVIADAGSIRRAAAVLDVPGELVPSRPIGAQTYLDR